MGHSHWYKLCADCGRWKHREEMVRVDAGGKTTWVCLHCLEDGAIREPVHDYEL